MLLDGASDALTLALAIVVAAGVIVVLLRRAGYGYARTRVLERLEAEMCRGQREGRRVALLILRYPDFGGLGSLRIGTDRDVLETIGACFRAYDHVERIGPGEFAVILGLTDDLREGIVRERLVRHGAPRHRFRVRVGLSRHPDDGVTPQILLDHAVRHSA